MKKLKVAVFGSGSCQQNDSVGQLAYNVGKFLANQGCQIVTGGYAGVMEAASAGAQAGNGTTAGIVHIPVNTRKPNDYLDKVFVVEDYQQRMAELLRVKVFVALPGSNGTFAEIAASFALASRHQEYYLAIYKPYWYSKLENVQELIDIHNKSGRIFWFNEVDELENWIDSIR